MAILRAGPWGNLSDSYQNAPSNTGADGLTLYPVNCAKADWPGQPWAAYYEVEVVEGCSGPATITATSTLSGTQQLTSVGGANCLYQWFSPYGEYYGRLEIYWDAVAGEWLYEQSFSYNLFDTSNGPTTESDPTGTYTSYQGTFTVTTP